MHTSWEAYTDTLQGVLYIYCIRWQRLELNGNFMALKIESVPSKKCLPLHFLLLPERWNSSLHEPEECADTSHQTWWSSLWSSARHIQIFTVHWTGTLIGLINLQSTSSAAGFCIPSHSSSEGCYVGILGGVQGIIRNFQSVLHSAGGHFKVTGEHGVLSAGCTSSLIQFW